MELTGSSSPLNRDPSGANRSKCQGIGLLTDPKDLTVFSRDLENQDHQDLSLIFLISILSTLIPVILIHGFLSMFFLSLTTQAKLGPSKNIIVDDSATAVASDGSNSSAARDTIAASYPANSDDSPAGHLAIDDGSDSPEGLIGMPIGQNGLETDNRGTRKDFKGIVRRTVKTTDDLGGVETSWVNRQSRSQRASERI